ncbi:MAG TPA: glycosyltransferase family 4 protein [Fimbriimonadaceae bacterium]|jgi:glycosyltransferase involved in cell wall biosynthesis
MHGNRPLKILVVNDMLPPDSEGGMELSAWELGKGLESRGHEVHWVCAEWRPSYKGSKQESKRVQRILKQATLPSKAETKLQSFNAIGQKINIAADNYEILLPLVKQEKYDVALIFGLLSVGLGTAQLFTDNGIPIVWSVGDVAIPVHFNLPNQTAVYRAAFGTVGRKWHAIERNLDFSRMLFTSGFVQEEFVKAGIRPRVSQVVPRALDFEPQMGEKKNPPLILVASRLTKARGIHTVLEAAKILNGSHPGLPWNLEIIGGGEESYLDQLSSLADQVLNRVTFRGQLPKTEVIARLGQASICINPTVEPEGFGRINIEALASGAALVATDVPSIHDIIDGYSCAETFQPGSFSELANVLENLLIQKEKRLEMAARGLARSEDFSMDSVLDRVVSQLQRAVDRQNPVKTNSYK